MVGGEGGPESEDVDCAGVGEGLVDPGLGVVDSGTEGGADGYYGLEDRGVGGGNVGRDLELEDFEDWHCGSR